MKLKQLTAELQKIDSFSKPKVHLEQYETPPELASEMVFSALQNEDICSDSRVVDLGCGTGMLGIGSVLCGANYVLAIDIDEDALSVAQGNVENILNKSVIDFMKADIRDLNFLCFKPAVNFDVAFINPPFGTKSRHADMNFLECASKTLGCRTIYSFHKGSTRTHVLKAGTAFGFNKCQVLAECRFPIYQTMRGHTKKCVDIDVDLIRFSH
ncbi:rRNA N6-adenosine-methyltransferase METTL5-like [Symsagittifera roscoffensis]|uniref:rRNA N6-adenosine-methyltransferase METTL5-like n=1 Tax=Symsagittifera roscoffensis TaxID=84072 RepID=UPI00307CA24F